MTTSNAGEDVEEVNYSYITGVNVKQFNCFGKQLDVPQKCQNEPKTYAQIDVHKCS